MKIPRMLTSTELRVSFFLRKPTDLWFDLSRCISDLFCWSSGVGVFPVKSPCPSPMRQAAERRWGLPTLAIE